MIREKENADARTFSFLLKKCKIWDTMDRDSQRRRETSAQL